MHLFDSESPMRKSQRITAAEWEALYRLSGELADFPVSDVMPASIFMLERLSRIIGAVGGFWMCAGRVFQGADAEKDTLHGWRPLYYGHFPRPDDFAVKLYQDWIHYRPNYLVDPHVQAVAADIGQRRCQLRPELVDDPTWAACATVQEVMRPLGIADRIISAFPLSTTAEIFIGVDRAPGETNFGPHERELLLRAGEGMGWLHRRLARSFGLIDAQRRLSPRECELVPLLLAGQSEKQVATALDLTPRSAHQLTVRLYRKFGVHGRAEFMAMWLNRR